MSEELRIRMTLARPQLNGLCIRALTVRKYKRRIVFITVPRADSSPKLDLQPGASKCTNGTMQSCAIPRQTARHIICDFTLADGDLEGSLCFGTQGPCGRPRVSEERTTMLASIGRCTKLAQLIGAHTLSSLQAAAITSGVKALA